MSVGYSVIRPFALIHRHSIGARRSIMLKPAPQSLRELPRAPPGSLPPPPGGFGLPPPPGFPGFRPGFPPMMPGMMRPPIMHGLRPAPNASVHQTGLTPSLLRLFVARPPSEYHPPPAKPRRPSPTPASRTTSSSSPIPRKIRRPGRAEGDQGGEEDQEGRREPRRTTRGSRRTSRAGTRRRIRSSRTRTRTRPSSSAG